MRLNDDDKTVAAMDVLVPKVQINFSYIKTCCWYQCTCALHEWGTKDLGIFEPLEYPFM